MYKELMREISVVEGKDARFYERETEQETIM